MSPVLQATRGVDAYAAAVRAELDDLSPEELEELTGGLEADLAEAMAGSRNTLQDTSQGILQITLKTPFEVFGPPKDYALELRSAAGLAPRRPGSRWPRAARIMRPQLMLARALVQAADQARDDARARFAQAVSGHAVSGQAGAGEAGFGQAVFVQAVSGQAASGQAKAGEARFGRAVSGRAVSGQAVSGRTGAGEAGLGQEVSAVSGQAGAGEAGFGQAMFVQAGSGPAWWPVASDVLVSLRHIWWGLRAFLAYWYLSQLGSQGMNEPLGRDLGLPYSPLTWLAMIGLLGLSVELGRRRWPALVGAVVVVLDLWLIVSVLLVVPVDLYWAP